MSLGLKGRRMNKKVIPGIGDCKICQEYHKEVEDKLAMLSKRIITLSKHCAHLSKEDRENGYFCNGCDIFILDALDIIAEIFPVKEDTGGETK